MFKIQDIHDYLLVDWVKHTPYGDGESRHLAQFCSILKANVLYSFGKADLNTQISTLMTQLLQDLNVEVSTLLGMVSI